MGQIDTRMLTIEDYNAIIKLWKLAGLPIKLKGRESKENMKKQMEVFPEFFIGAFHRKKLIGVVIGSYDGRMKGWINRLAVKPEYRRTGIAKQLIDLLEKVLERQGAAVLCALIESPNEESLSLFQRMGYILHDDILYVSKRRSSEV